MLFGSHLRVSECVAYGEGHAINGNFDIGVAYEVLTATVALNVQFSTTVEAENSTNTQVELIVKQRFRQTCGYKIKSTAPALKGIAFGRGNCEGAQFEIPW